MNKFSTRLLRFISKAIKYIVREIFPTYFKSKAMATYCVSCKGNARNKTSTKQINAFIKLCCLWQEKIKVH